MAPLKCFTILADIHPFMHTCTHRQQHQPCKVTAISLGAVRVLRDTSTL